MTADPGARPLRSSSRAPSVVRLADLAAAAFWLGLLVLFAVGPGLLDLAALRPEGWMDADPLYSSALRPPPPHSDFTPLTVDLPRDLFFARQLHAGRGARDPGRK